MDLIVTGVAGFLGSHVVLNWLSDYPTSRVLCLVRANNHESAVDRVMGALRVAVAEMGSDLQPQTLSERIDVLEADITNSDWRYSPAFLDWTQRSAGFEVIHGAANLSFRQEDRDSVWGTNVHGTSSFLQNLVGLTGLKGFNYISTAYVAGGREGYIDEHFSDRPTYFNNVYEESKWFAERVVRDLSNQAGIVWRIFRPSIIIGHSKTYRISSKTGFYKVLEMLLQCAQLSSCSMEEVLVPIHRNASLNLIPIDFVVLEMMDIIRAGSSGFCQIFHLTNERPLSLADIFFGVTPLTGVNLVFEDDCEKTRAAGVVAALLKRGLRHYQPYFHHDRVFGRCNVQALGAERHQQEYRLDLMRLREFARVFIEKENRQAKLLEKVRA
jgi:thioester reductase-like protein